MKKYLFVILIPIILGGCEKTNNDIVDSQISYQVESVNTVNNFLYQTADSLITVSIKLNSASDIRSIYFDIYSSDNTQLNASPVEMYDDGTIANGDTTAGDNIYSAKFPLNKSYPVGLYTIKFFITDLNNNTRQVAVRSFEYDNNQISYPPQISDLVAPDSVIAEDPKTVIFMSVKVSDPNGLSDIKQVYFISYRPDGTTSGDKNQMYDDGNKQTDGDAKAGDGIYSILIEVTPQNAKGTYRFDFRAVDRTNKLSNIISHNIVVQ
ncbi:MAG: choice-of-anchor X domain-containing protein [Ignavibacteriaceae bacterium]